VRIGFVTCVELGFACLEELVALGAERSLNALKVVVTLNDSQAVDKSGRVSLDAFCRQHDVALIKSANANDDHVVEQLRSLALDWLFIVGWSQIAKSALLNTAKYGALGIHPTLLPEGRGRGPIPWAIIKGLERTGVTLFKLDDGVDSGDVVLQSTLLIASNETATTLYARVKQEHRALIRTVWPQLLRGHVDSTAQDESRASHWPQRKPEHGCIRSTMTVSEVDRLVRAVAHPYPGAFVERDGQVIRVWAGTSLLPEAEALHIECADGSYWATHWQR
jgi:methionyl-tRNA formyltransferase